MLMKIVLIAGSIVLPLFMVFIQYRWRKMCSVFNILMVISVLIAGDIAAMSLYQVIRDNAVFMTRIHGLFLNPLFMATGAYAGLYTIYRLMLLSWKEWRGN